MLNPKRLELKQNCHMRANESKWVLSRRVCYLQSQHKDFFLTLFTFLIPMCLLPL